MSFTLSILVPVFNEEKTIGALIDRVEAVECSGGIKKQLIIIDDGSTDRTAEVVKKSIFNRSFETQFVQLPKNQGKGKAISSALNYCIGEYTIILDADLEYDPEEMNILVEPALKGFADVVYGSRFVGGRAHRILFFWHTIGNKFLTFISNMFTNLNLTDMEVGYKLFRTSILKSLSLKEKSFGFEPEVTAKISKIKGLRIYEVGVSYYGRTYEDGKKIKWTDGVRALYCIFKYNIMP